MGLVQKSLEIEDISDIIEYCIKRGWGPQEAVGRLSSFISVALSEMLGKDEDSRDKIVERCAAVFSQLYAELGANVIVAKSPRTCESLPAESTDTLQ